MAGSKKIIPALTGLRAVIIAWVVVWHFRVDIVNLVPSLKVITEVTASAHYRMDLLFMLSGFLISYAYISPQRGLSLKAYGHVLGARLSRIYPSYLVVLILSVLVVILAPRFGIQVKGYYPFKDLPLHLAMVQVWPYFYRPGSTWSSPTWFLSAIWFAYLFALPAAWLLVGRIRSSWAAVFWVFAPIAVWFAVARIFPYVGLCSVVRASCGFVSGSALFALHANAGPIIVAAQKHLDKAVLVFLSMTLLLPVLPDTVRHCFNALLVLGIPVLMAGLTGESSLTARLLSARPLAWLAGISYAIFLTHDPAASALLHTALPTDQFATSSFPVRYSVAALYLIVMLVSAIALHRLVEVPCAKALKAFVSPRWTKLFHQPVSVARPIEAKMIAKRAP